VAKLRPQEERDHLAVVIDHLPMGVLVVDAAGEIVHANPSARRLLRPTSLQQGARLPEPWPGVSLAAYANRLLEHGFGPERRVAVDGKGTYALTGVRAREAGTAILLIDDITSNENRVRAEREFVANAAHELLTPLTGIVSAAHVLEAGAKDVPEDRDKFVAHIAQECSRLTRIARSLLVLARAQSGEEPPRLDIFPLRELLEEAVTDMGAKVAIHCADDLKVLTDADLFLQAASNLVTNAVRHSNGDAVAIEAQAVARNVVQVDIRDGSRSRDDIGQFRARFHTSSGRDGGGFGLGLSIAEQSLDVIGARLSLSDGGARIELPRGG
jgi:two-component system, OmpR family, sensor histidine kinase VicK